MEQHDDPRGEVRAPRDITGKVIAQCAPYGRIETVRLYCSAEHPDKTVAMVDLHGNPTAAAAAIQGIVFGSNKVCKTEPLPPTFRCPGRPEGTLIHRVCDACVVQPSPPGTPRPGGGAG